jgi:uncharacterized protein (TIGR03437 family)
MNGTGTGVAAATAVEVQTGNLQSPVTVFQCGSSGCVAVPITLSAGSPVYLTLYGSGIRNFSSIANVEVTINGVSVPIQYAGPQSSFAGLDQVNVSLPASLEGSGLVNVILTVDGRASNTVQVDIQ